MSYSAVIFPSTFFLSMFFSLMISITMRPWMLSVWMITKPLQSRLFSGDQILWAGHTMYISHQHFKPSRSGPNAASKPAPTLALALTYQTFAGTACSLPAIPSIALSSDKYLFWIYSVTRTAAGRGASVHLPSRITSTLKVSCLPISSKVFTEIY